MRTDQDPMDSSREPDQSYHQAMERWARVNAAFALVVSGPSGVGKTSIVDHLLLLDPLCTRSVSATTRIPRAGEVEGESYLFVTDEAFMRIRGEGALAESALYNGSWYGTPKAFLEEQIGAGRCVVLNIEVQGGLQVRSHYPEAVLVFVVPPSWDELRRRLMGRGTDTRDAVEGRIRRGREELRQIAHYDYVIVNDVIERCAEDLAAIVRAERRRVARLQGGADAQGL